MVVVGGDPADWFLLFVLHTSFFFILLPTLLIWKYNSIWSLHLFCKHHISWRTLICSARVSLLCLGTCPWDSKYLFWFSSLIAHCVYTTHRIMPNLKIPIKTLRMKTLQALKKHVRERDVFTLSWCGSSDNLVRMSLQCILNTLAFTGHREPCARSCDQSTPCENGSLPCLEYFSKGHGDNLTTVVESRELLGITSFLFSLLHVLRAQGRGCVASGRETLRHFNASKKKHWPKNEQLNKRDSSCFVKRIRL